MAINQQRTDDELKQAFDSGEIFVYPTEAVFGIGCDPDNQSSVEKLCEIKQRPISKGLILIAANYSQVLPYVDDEKIPQHRRSEIFASWPGPVTWLLPKSASAPAWVTGEHELIAVRVTGHQLVQELCTLFEKPFISTSANLSGKPPAKSASEAEAQLGDGIIYIEGATDGRDSPSVIKNGLTGDIIRA